MTKAEIALTAVSCVLFVAALIITFIVYYYKIKAYVTEHMADEIADAEEGADETDGKGQEQLEKVVEDLYRLVPKILQPFITEKLLTKIVQLVFNGMKKFAEKQAKKTISE